MAIHENCCDVLKQVNKSRTTRDLTSTTSKFTIHTIGLEIGYQFILWKRLALDFVFFGPGFGFYNYKATFESNLDPVKESRLLQALKQLITQRIPGMNYVFSNEEFDAFGAIRIIDVGSGYLIQVGYNF